MNNQQVLAADGLLSKAINFLFKGLDKLIADSLQEQKSKLKVAETKPIEKEGKMGKTYKFAIDEEGYDGGVYVDAWPIGGEKNKNIVYVDRIVPYGSDDNNDKIKVKDFEPKVINQNEFGNVITKLLEDSGYNVIVTDTGDREESDKNASESARDYNHNKDQNEVASKYFGLDEGVTDAATALENANASTWKFRAKLQKVIASNTFDLVTVDYKDDDASKIWDAICDIAENQEFCDSVQSEEPVCIEVSDDANGNLDVQPIEDFIVNCGDVARYLYELAVNAKHQLCALDCACRDGQFQAFCEPISWIVKEMVCDLCRLRIKYENIYPNPGTVTCTGSNLTEAINGCDGIQLLQSIAQGLVDAVSLKGYSFPEIDRQALMCTCQRLEDRIVCDLNPYIESMNC